MQFFIFVILTAMIAFATIGSASTSDSPLPVGSPPKNGDARWELEDVIKHIPACAMSCKNEALLASGCTSVNDFKCLCGNASKMEGLESCVIQACGWWAILYEDFRNLKPNAARICDLQQYL